MKTAKLAKGETNAAYAERYPRRDKKARRKARGTGWPGVSELG